MVLAAALGPACTLCCGNPILRRRKRSSTPYDASMSFATYRFVGIRSVRGWLVPHALDVLAMVLDGEPADGGGVAEIGVHHGKLFIALQLLSPTGPSLAVDVFGAQDLNIDRSGSGDRERFVANVKRWGMPQTLVVREADSTTITRDQLAADLPAGARLFSVDGGHTKEIVHSDLKLAEAACTERGIVIADDVFNGSWPGVAEGTLSYLADGSGLRPFAIAFNKVLLARETAAQEYYARLLERATPRRRWLVREQEFVSSPVVSIATRPKNMRGLAERSALITKAYQRLS